MPKQPERCRITANAFCHFSHYYENGIGWLQAPAPTRYIAIYIFAWHGVTDDATCDQADPAQWRFYVVPTTKLPETNTVTLATLKGMGPGDGYDQDNPLAGQRRRGRR